MMSLLLWLTLSQTLDVDTSIGRERLSLGAFTTPLPVAVVAGRALRCWQRAGLPTIVDGDGLQALVASAFATREGWQWVLVLRRQGTTTLGVLALKDLRLTGEPMALRLPPTENALIATSGAEAGGREGVRWSVAAGDVPSVLVERHRALLAAGAIAIAEAQLPHLRRYRLGQSVIEVRARTLGEGYVAVEERSSTLGAQP